MRFGTARTPDGDRVVVRDGARARILPLPSVRQALSDGALTEDGAADLVRSGRPVDLGDLDLAPAVSGGKVVCVGHNFTSHILELGHGLPERPNVFSKFPEALVGPNDDIHLDVASDAWDWEAELAVVIGTAVRWADRETAARAIAGYSVANDVSARDWQRRASQWLLGKTFEATTPLGPWIVTPDEVDPAAGLEISCSIDGVTKQQSTTADLLFDAPSLIAYVSQVVTLQPGDVILTGTPGGVGTARTPTERLLPGQLVVTAVEGIGECRNRCVSSGQRPTSNA
jgi:acylpyruvate hydrolase